MFWIIVKIALFLLAVAGLTLGAEQLMHSTGGFRIAVMDLELTLGPLQAAVAALALLALLWVVFRIVALLVAVLRFITGDASALTRFFQDRRKRQGLDALTDGFLALAEGDGARARSKARKAESVPEARTLFHLLMAQAAESSGDADLAEAQWKALVADDRSRFAGVQGLIARRLAAGDTETARALADKALKLQPMHGPTQTTLLTLQTRSGDWEGARKTLQIIARVGGMPAEMVKHRDAVLILQQAAALGDSDAARDLAIEANGLAPELIPAAVKAAAARVARSEGPVAGKLLRKAWAAQPHPDLARAYADIAPDEAPADRVARFEKLLAQTPDHDEARLTRAELLIAADDFPAARRALGDLATRAPTQRVLAAMAAIERGEGAEDAVVRDWLARALTAPRGPQWVCDRCQHSHAGWVALCENCGALDSLAWRGPEGSAETAGTGGETRPLNVGGSRKTDATAAAGGTAG